MSSNTTAKQHVFDVVPINLIGFIHRKMHYPPETTTIRLIIKLLAMYKQTDNKAELLNATQDFHHELINQDLMLSHKMQGENHQRDLANLYEIYAKSFDFTGMEVVSDSFTCIGSIN